MKTRDLNEQEKQQVNGGAIGLDSIRLNASNKAHASARAEDGEESEEVRFSDNTSADFSTED